MKEKKGKIVGKNIIICSIHGNKEYSIKPTHFCKYKIEEKCFCKCSCDMKEEKNKENCFENL